MTQMRPRGGNYTPSSKDFTVNNASTTISIDSPYMIIACSCNGTYIGEKWIPGLGFSKLKRVRDARKVHSKTNCLVRVGVGRNDGCHESNPSSQTITRVPSACRIKAVFMMGIDKCVKESPKPQYNSEDSAGTPGMSSRVVSSFLVAIS